MPLCLTLSTGFSTLWGGNLPFNVCSLIGLSKVLGFQFVLFYIIVRMGVTIQAFFILERKLKITEEFFTLPWSLDVASANLLENA